MASCANGGTVRATCGASHCGQQECAAFHDRRVLQKVLDGQMRADARSGRFILAVWSGEGTPADTGIRPAAGLGDREVLGWGANGRGTARRRAAAGSGQQLPGIDSRCRHHRGWKLRRGGGQGRISGRHDDTDKAGFQSRRKETYRLGTAVATDRHHRPSSAAE
jgi:hypothetical protein